MRAAASLHLRSSQLCSICLRRSQQTVAQQSPGSSNVSTENIFQPKTLKHWPVRVKRGKTDILKALASTVDASVSAPYFQYIDDPYLQPIVRTSKITYALSEQYGRYAARHFATTFPTLFMCENDDPKMNIFRPPGYPQSEELATIESESELIQYMDQEFVYAAIVAYRNLVEKGVEISEPTKFNLLQLLCFHNCRDKVETSVVEHFFQDAYVVPGRKPLEKVEAVDDSSNVWEATNEAESLFTELENPGAEAYSALICGRFKYNDGENAIFLFEEMRAKGFRPSRDVYRALISYALTNIGFSDHRVERCRSYLKLMSADEILPDRSIFDLMLKAVDSGSQTDKLPDILEILGEMTSLSVQPSLETLSIVLNACQRSPQVYNVLLELMTMVDQQADSLPKSPMDCKFFAVAMELALKRFENSRLADRIHTLLAKVDCPFTTIRTEENYYHFYLLSYLNNQQLKFEEFMTLYRKFVPYVYPPSERMLRDILIQIDLKRVPEYIGEIWTTTYLLGSFRQFLFSKILDSCLIGMDPKLNRQDQDSLNFTLKNVAFDLLGKVNAQYDVQYPRTALVKVTVELLTDVALIGFRAGFTDDAVEIVDRLLTEDHEEYSVAEWKVQELLKWTVENCNRKKTKDLHWFLVKYSCISEQFSENFVSQVKLVDE